MKVFRGLESVSPALSHSVLTVGNFDGVHRAHQQLLAQAGLFAAGTGGPVVVLTFEPHPSSVLAGHDAPPRLCTLDQKLHHLEESGADVTVVAQSEPRLLGLEPEAFVTDVLIGLFHPTHMVEGPSFGFGRGRRGDAKLLGEIAGRHGCQVHVVDPITLRIQDDETVLISSTLVRRLLTEGQVHRAALCLGRPYSLAGVVESGSRRGRTIGFPTANLRAGEQLVPADGVYAGVTAVAANRFRSAISVGRRPTFDDGLHQVEVHLIDFDGELLGREISVEFHRLLRRQRRFESPEALSDQIGRDVAAARHGRQWTRPDAPGDGAFDEATKAHEVDRI